MPTATFDFKANGAITLSISIKPTSTLWSANELADGATALHSRFRAAAQKAQILPTLLESDTPSLVRGIVPYGAICG